LWGGVDNPCQVPVGSESHVPRSTRPLLREPFDSALSDPLDFSTSSPAMLKNLQAEYMTLTANYLLHGVGNVPRPSLRRQNSCTKRLGSSTAELRE
jgi:hypothetical protein